MLVEVLGFLDVLEVDGFCDTVDDLVFLDLLLFGVFVLEDLANHVLKQYAPHVGPEGFLHDVLGERIQLCVVCLHDAVQGPESLRVREQSLFAEVVVPVDQRNVRHNGGQSGARQNQWGSVIRGKCAGRQPAQAVHCHH